MFFVVIVLLLIWGCLAVYQTLSNSRLMPMTQILISGQRHYVENSDLQKALARVPESGNFFTLNVNKVQQALVALPWIKQASVRKLWPNKLRIYMQERVPVAHWNHKDLLTPKGQIFDASQKNLKKPLVQLNGPDDYAAKVLAAWQQMRQLVRPLHLDIRSVTLNARDSWSLVLSNGIALRIGVQDRIKRLKRFVALYGQLHPEKMAYADLRYNNGLAVGWKEQ
ncbi:MAG: Cell division protein FtsQ [Candidatus Celerinatantimonas neptuna]|nr:MAG: Cell division protein FtsQ [Candidatus Celerinatantimonas neptuna]